jgi:hypothetical protein
MKIHELFEKKIDRPIEGVIKADDEEHLATEVEEYIVTNEVAKHLDTFFEAYNSTESAQGVWISGFFGSGKSHLLKILSLVLESREVNGKAVGPIFEAKADDAMLRAEIVKALKVPSKSILFNIDQKADVINTGETDAILSVFLKVFNEMQGYYPKQPYIAQFERDLDKQGKYQEFKNAFERIAGESWEMGRETAHVLSGEQFAQVYAEVMGSSKEEGLKILDRYQKSFVLSIEGFVGMVKEYVDRQGPKFRLNFFVDEVGQFIADNTKLMVNMQTIAESFATKCKGQAWILVTSQEDLSKVVGEMASVHNANDFSKIQDRFPIRLNLTSSNVAEVIQKRLLKKKGDDSVQTALRKLYDTEQANFGTLFNFIDGSRTFRTFRDNDEFCSSYPFPQYQYELFKSSIEALSRHNAFTGKHASVGERSMLGVFQDVAKQIADKPFGALGSFDLMFGGIRKVIKAEHQAAIHLAENNLTNDLAIRILKALFLVKYLKEFKGTPHNIGILMIDQFDLDLAAHVNAVKEALNLLEQNTYIQRTGECYEFLTDDEKDVENEIKGMDVDDTATNGLAAQIIYDEILRDTKIRFEDNKQDYPFSRKLDSTLIGREHELEVNMISPFNEHHGDEPTLISHALGKPEMLVLLASDKRLLSDLNLYAKTDKYVRQNKSSGLADSLQTILADKAIQNIRRKEGLRERLTTLLSEAKVIVNGAEQTGLSADARTRISQGFESLIRFAYPNLKMLKAVFTDESLRNVLTEDGDDLFTGDDQTVSEAELEILTIIRRQQANGEKPKVGTLLAAFSKKPYGWYQAGFMTNLAKLYMRGKVELRADANTLEKAGVLEHLTNNRHFNNTLVLIQASFDARSVQQLKAFHQEFFDEANPGSEAKEVADQFIKRLEAEIPKLQTLRAQGEAFPFVSALDEPIAMLEAWVGKPYAVFLKDLADFKDDWLDAKEDLLDPIRSFVHGQQGKVYDEVRRFASANKENLPAFTGEGSILTNFLADETPFRGDGLQQAKAAVETLKVAIGKQLTETRQDAENKIREATAHLEALAGFADLNEAQQNQLREPAEQASARVRDTSVLAVVRDTLNRHLNEGRVGQVDMLNTFLSEAGKPASKLVTSGSIPVTYGKSTIESDSDLDEYLNSVRIAYGDVLKDNGKITL